MRARRDISVKIPAGVGDGMRVRLAAQGEVGPGGGPAGDLYVEVHEQPHDIFVRDGDDLHCTVRCRWSTPRWAPRSAVDAILDGPTEITIPPGTQPGAVTTLRGHGMPHLRSGVRGDLHAHIEVGIPTKLDARTGNCSAEVKSRSHEQAQVASPRTRDDQLRRRRLFSRLRETFSGR